MFVGLQKHPVLNKVKFSKSSNIYNISRHEKKQENRTFTEEINQ